MLVTCHISIIETFMPLIQSPLKPVSPQPLDHVCKIKDTDKSLPDWVVNNYISCSTLYLIALISFHGPLHTLKDTSVNCNKRLKKPPRAVILVWQLDVRGPLTCLPTSICQLQVPTPTVPL